MNIVYILSSFHIEYGKCNSIELFKIIEQLQPDVIFEELSIDVFNLIYSEGYMPMSLEAITVKNYLKNYHIQHIPVDTYDFNEKDLFIDFEIVLNRSLEYTEMFKYQALMIFRYGYDFLNSTDCDELIDKMRMTEEKVLADINDIKLINQYKSEQIVHNKREDIIIQNIYNYSDQHPFKKAVLICGVEHRKSIMEKIEENKMKVVTQLNWKLYKDFPTNLDIP